MSKPLGTTQPSFLSLPNAYRLLTKVQSSSAMVFSVFTTIHGLQILVANTGGVAASNHWILLGRPFYQDEHLEGLLVTGSALVHVTAGLVKGLIRGNRKLSYHQLAGYGLIPLAGLHYYLVRTLPLQQYGDSGFIDFGYVAWGLQNKPWFTFGLHSALGLVATYHVVKGTRSIVKGRKGGSGWTETSMIIGLGLAFISSLVIIGNQTKKIPLRLDFEKMYQRII